MSKMVKGIYTNAQETLAEINKLKAEGYTTNEITVVTAQGKNSELKDLDTATISTADITKDNYKKGDPADNPLAEYGVPDDVANDLNYKKELEDGKILIIIDDKKELRENSTSNKPLL